MGNAKLATLPESIGQRAAECCRVVLLEVQESWLQVKQQSLSLLPFLG